MHNLWKIIAKATGFSPCLVSWAQDTGLAFRVTAPRVSASGVVRLHMCTTPSPAPSLPFNTTAIHSHLSCEWDESAPSGLLNWVTLISHAKWMNWNEWRIYYQLHSNICQPALAPYTLSTLMCLLVRILYGHFIFKSLQLDAKINHLRKPRVYRGDWGAACYSRRPRFKSQHSHNSSQPSVMWPSISFSFTSRFCRQNSLHIKLIMHIIIMT